MFVRFAAGAARLETARAIGAPSPLVATTREPALVVEPHQQPGTTQARWIGFQGVSPDPIPIRWSIRDDSPRWPAPRDRDAMTEG
jgi:hypothetical protein